MDDFGTLARDFGFRPQGKSAPMSASKPSGSVNAGTGSAASTRSTSGKSAWNSTPSGASLLGDDDGLFAPSKNRSPPNYDYNDVFGGPPRYSNPSTASSASAAASPFDSLFQGSKDSSKTSSMPVFDKPVYDDDIFDGVPGIKTSSSVSYDDVFASMSSPPKKVNQFDDLLGNFRGADKEVKGSSGRRSGGTEQEVSGFDDLIPGFGGSSPPPKRETAESKRPHQSSGYSSKSSSSILDDPFVVLETTSVPSDSSSGLFTDPLEHINKPSNSGSTKADGSVSGGIFDNIDAFDGLTKSVPVFSSEINKSEKSKSPSRAGRNLGSSHTTAGNGSTEKTSMNNFEDSLHKKAPVDDYQESHPTSFGITARSSNSQKSVGRGAFHPKDVNPNSNESNSQDVSPKSGGNLETADDVWLTVSEIPLFTQPTSAPPPSRPAPTLDVKADRGYSAGFNAKGKADVSASAKNSGVSTIDELEDFVMGKPRTYVDERTDVLSSEEEMETNSAAAASAAAMKEAMDRAEAKFKHAREVRERENAKVVRSREPTQQEEEKARKEAQEREYKERQERLDREQREREEKEKEQKRLEKEREREREIERGRARQAVERATKEARERAAAEARLRAERAVVGKVNAEARERAERAAVQRAAAEARERAAADARERAEKAATEARERTAAEARQRAAERAATEARERAAERAATEARERAAVDRAASEVRLRAERAAVERAAAEARERAAQEARERASAAAREKQQQQQRNEHDLESFFSMGARPNSAPRQRATTSDSAFDTRFQSKGSSDGARRTSAGTSSSIKKASSTTNIVDDLASMFGAATSGEEFAEVEGETEERRRARLERHQRTLERTKKALAEKNERDMQAQRDQIERHRIAETLDIEIKRWAAGKEGNLRALLSTMQYVLWPECGWQPVSLTDLITGASVKKAYRKATLCIHPDKVQQKGANLQQKYIAEKVFDLLKEAWNKFNSEELF